jgi:hypothetical protein
VPELRKAVTNDTDRLMLVFIEPEGWDCWLRPGESAEVRAGAVSPADSFVFEEHGEGVTVWPSDGMGVISVYQNGCPLECGHQRPDGWA